MEKNTKIFLAIGALILVIIGIIIGLVVYFNKHASPDADTSVINNSNPATTTTTSQLVNQHSGKKTTTQTPQSDVSTKPLNVNIVTGSDNPTVVKTYNNDSPITNISVNENVNKQNEIDNSKILNNNDVNNSSAGQNFVQSSTSNLP